MKLKKSVAKVLERERVCRVATTGPAGMPHVVPVCHLLVDGTICFASDGKAKKIQHLRANPRVAITVDNYAEDWSALRGVMVQGSARLIESGPRFRKLQQLLYEKYPQYPEDAALGKAAVIVEVTPKHIFDWGLD